MTESVIQTKSRRWSGPDTGLSQGLGVSFILSVLVHVLFGAIIVVALLHSGAPPSVPHPTFVDLEIVEFADLVPAAHEVQAQPSENSEDARPREETRRQVMAQEHVSEPLPVPRPETTGWRPFDPDRKGAVDLKQLMTLAACPRFAAPSDLRLSGKCAGRWPGLINPEVSTKAAAKVAAVRNREAVKRGWVTASLPEPPDQIKASLEPAAKTPGEEVFGPWPWDVGR